jgi:hypothetical protein
MFDGKAYGEEIVGLVRGYVERELGPLKAENERLVERIAALEARQPEKGDAGERGMDGVSPEAEVVAEAFRPIAATIIADAVAEAVAALPAPERGEKGDTGERGEKGSDGNDGRDGADGKDGRGVKDLLIDRTGALIATMDDGEMKSLGPVIGKDGDAGKDGRDGIDLTSFDAIVLDDDRTIELKFVSGEEERVASFKWPTILDRGVYKAGEVYDPGDAVSWGGSLWIAQKTTDAKPDTPDSGWRLSVKRGRDGKDAKIG